MGIRLQGIAVPQREIIGQGRNPQFAIIRTGRERASTMSQQEPQSPQITQSQKTYRVAIIGCGGRGREHAGGLRADARCKVVALCDVKPDAAETLQADFGFADAAFYDDYAVMLREARPDVVAICLWTPLHRAAFEACIDAGIRAILSEKPMTPTWGESQAMSRIAEEAGCQLTFCHQRRFAVGNQLVRRLLAEGRIGKVERMDLYSPRHLLDCGTHTFDQAH